MANYVFAMFLLFILCAHMVAGSTNEIKKLQKQLVYKNGRGTNLENKIAEVEIKIDQKLRAKDLLNQKLETMNEIIREKEENRKVQEKKLEKIEKFENILRPNAMQKLRNQQIEIDELSRDKNTSKMKLEKKKKEIKELILKEKEKFQTLKKNLEEKIQMQIKLQENLKYELHKETELKTKLEEELIEPRAKKKERIHLENLKIKEKNEKKKKMEKEEEKKNISEEDVNKFNTPPPKKEIKENLETPIKKINMENMRKMKIKVHVEKKEVDEYKERRISEFLEIADIKLVTKEGKKYDGHIIRELFDLMDKESWFDYDFILEMFHITKFLHNVEVPKSARNCVLDTLKESHNNQEYCAYFKNCQEFLDANYITQKETSSDDEFSPHKF